MRAIMAKGIVPRAAAGRIMCLVVSQNTVQFNVTRPLSRCMLDKNVKSVSRKPGDRFRFQVS